MSDCKTWYRWLFPDDRSSTDPKTLPKRPALWAFERLDTLRRRLIQRAGRLIRPQGQLTLSMSANPAVQNELLHYLEAL